MRTILLAAFCLFSVSVQSQSGSISGFVLDSLQSGIIGAIMTCNPGNFKTTTNEIGYYEFTNLPSGRFKVSVQSLGCEFDSQEIEITAAKGIHSEINFICRHVQLVTDSISSVLETSGMVLSEVQVESTRASGNTPVTYTNISKSHIESINTSQDLPQILRYTPSLVSTSDAGNGVGYTGLWIRGSDPSRINVTVNGIPMNDPESQQVFWVNTPDLASSASSIQVQRGIGTSANGSASFGGNIKIETRDVRTDAYAETKNTYGSFNTMRNTINFGTGLLKEHFVFEGRLSRIVSDGYIDRAKSDLKSFFFEGNYVSDRTTVKLNMFGGREKTYQSWYGTPASILQNDQDSLFAYAIRNGLNDTQLSNLIGSGRTYNFYQYDNQTDNYGQDHYQAHLSHNFGAGLRINLSGHYTHGEGYYEEFKADEDYESYGLNPVVYVNDTILSTDIIRRRWLKNDFYGAVGAISFNRGGFESILGGAYNEYKGNHFGELTWMEFAGPNFIDEKYYEGKSLKRDGNIYWRNTYNFSQFAAYADLQIRSVNYSTSGIDNDLVNYNIEDNLLFFNPKLGITYSPNGNQRFYASVAQASKEPNRNDYIDAIDYTKVMPEEMTDLEVGYQYRAKTWFASANVYYMDYDNQLVLTGAVNDVGASIRMNVPKSYRRGLEIQAGYHRIRNLGINGNITLSQNKIESFEETLYDYTNGYDIITIPHSNKDISFSPSVIAGGNVSYSFFFGLFKNELRFDWFTKYVGKQYLDNTQNDYMSIDPYFINDLKAGFTVRSFDKCKIELSGFVHNLFDLKYSSNGYTYSYVYEARITERFYFPQAGRNYSIVLGITF